MANESELSMKQSMKICEPNCARYDRSKEGEAYHAPNESEFRVEPHHSVTCRTTPTRVSDEIACFEIGHHFVTKEELGEKDQT